jgi:polyhydroxybutyrate depolymerase
MDAVADAGGFIVAYPAGTSRGLPLLTWNVLIGDTYATAQNVDDVGFAGALLDDLQQRYAVDATRVYVAGYSQGAMLGYRLACAMGDRFAAMAAVAGVMTVKPEDCGPGRPLPLIHFHGLLDRHCPYEGGVGETKRDRVARPSVDDTIKFWIARNGLSAAPVSESIIGQAVKQDRGSVILWTLKDGGHTWPGGECTLASERVGPINRDIHASELIWDFFKRHVRC